MKGEITAEPAAVAEEEIIKPKKKPEEAVAPPKKVVEVELKPIEEKPPVAPPVKKIEVELVPEEFQAYKTEFPEPPSVPPVVDRPIVLDIETTGPNPWDARIICISAADLTQPEAPITTFVDDDEKKMVNDFIRWYEDNGFNEIIGFLVAFDLRFIFAKCLRYLISAPQFTNSRLYDIANVLKQVKTEFVYNLNKQGSLEDWVSFLFDKHKLMTMKEVFEAYKRKEIDKIVEYNKNDVLLTTLIYAAIIFVKGSE